MTNLTRRYGWKPDIPDIRDFGYSLIKPWRLLLPSSIDLRPNCSPVKDQGDASSCTGNALGNALEYLEIKDKKGSDTFSRLFIYYNEREAEGNINADGGAFIRDGIKTLATIGACHESTWPYNLDNLTIKPSNEAYVEASNHRITSYYRIGSLGDMRNCLASGYPVAFGFSVYENFEGEECAKTGIVRVPGPTERMIGGHAVLAVGYDDKTKMVLVKNSWGADWGIGGYFWLPYEYIENRNLSDDFWTIKMGENI